MKRKAALEKELPDIGTKVKLLLREKRMTQTDLAKLAGWHQPTVTTLLRRRNWTVTQVKRASIALNTNLFLLYVPESTEGMVPAALLQEAAAELQELQNKLRAAETEITALSTEVKVLNRVLGKG